MDWLRIQPGDNVAVALTDLKAGREIPLAEGTVTLGEDIPRGHKFALTDLAPGEPVLKYGAPIGTASRPISRGSWVHVHNVKTGLEGAVEYQYHPAARPLAPVPAELFPGFVRRDGGVGVRNELWIIPTVGCVNGVAQALAARGQRLVRGSVGAAAAFSHPYGCSQLGEDQENTRRILADLIRHPNAGGVLVVGLGCENSGVDRLKERLGDYDPDRVKFLVCQEAEDELAAGEALLEELAEYAGGFRREPVPCSRLVVGLKCGGSDGLSGITANPAVGGFSDRLIARGGAAILTEVPEMFGAEQGLMDRCATPELFRQTVELVNGYKDYFRRHGQAVYENPSPGNKAGGITTLEDKSLGCTQKAGSAPVEGVLAYGERVSGPGLHLLSAPGNDLVAATALAAAGAQIVLFTTGRGTPFGCPAPTVKISSNTPLARRKEGWIDFDAGTAAEGEPLEAVSQALFDLVLEVAAGKLTRAEEMGCREMAIFKQGVTL